MKPTKEQYDLIWNLLAEMRKETLEAQRMRTQVIGFKITFVSTGIGIIASIKRVPKEMLIIPAFASVFFDLLIVSYSIAIRRTVIYCRSHLEPVLRGYTEMPDSFLFWEEFIDKNELRRVLAIIGNLGLTFLAVLAGAYGLFRSTQLLDQDLLRFAALGMLLILFLYSFVAFSIPARITNEGNKFYRLFFEAKRKKFLRREQKTENIESPQQPVA